MMHVFWEYLGIKGHIMCTAKWLHFYLQDVRGRLLSTQSSMQQMRKQLSETDLAKRDAEQRNQALQRERDAAQREKETTQREKDRLKQERDTLARFTDSYITYHSLLLILKSRDYNSTTDCSHSHVAMNVSARRRAWRRPRRQRRAATRSCRWTARSFSWPWCPYSESGITRGRRRRPPFRRETGQRQRHRECK